MNFNTPYHLDKILTTLNKSIVQTHISYFPVTYNITCNLIDKQMGSRIIIYFQ